MTTDIPKPSPIPLPAPKHAKSEGLNDDGAEARRRIVQMLLPQNWGVDDLLTVASWIEHGDDEEDET